jgi:hypothetical protein
MRILQGAKICHVQQMWGKKKRLPLKSRPRIRPYDIEKMFAIGGELAFAHA